MTTRKYPEDYSAVRLVCGVGIPRHCGCWMSTLRTAVVPNMKKWSDVCPTVSPVVSTLCVMINDSFASDETRTQAIMEFGFTRPLDSASGDDRQRTALFYTWLLREYLPFVLQRVELPVPDVLLAFPDDARVDFKQVCSALDAACTEITRDYRIHIAAIADTLRQYEGHEHITIDDALEYVAGMLRRYKYRDEYENADWELLTSRQYLIVLDRMLRLGDESTEVFKPVDGFEAFYERVGTEPLNDDDGQVSE